MIVLQKIQKRYREKIVLDDFSYTVEKGAFLVITGASGSGKTTLLNIMGLLETPDKGSVCIDGQEFDKPRKKQMFYRYKAGFLFQNFALLEDKTVFENLKLALQYQKSTSKKHEISEALEEVGLSGIEGKKVFQLSGGEQQRLALARLLLKNPQYIFADEPSGNLDMQNRDLVFDHLEQLNKRGKTVLLVTHDNDLVAKAKELICL